MKNSLKTTKVTFILIMVIGLIIIGLSVYVGLNGKIGKKPSPTGTPGSTPTSAGKPSGKPTEKPTGKPTDTATPTTKPLPTHSQAPTPSEPQNGDTTADGVVMSVDPANKTVKVYFPEKDVYLDLSYNGATDIRTAYGNVMSATVLTPASIAEVSYNAGENKLCHLYLLNDYWTIASAANWEMMPEQSMMKVGANYYRLSKNVATVSSEGAFEVSKLEATDVINISGRNGRVYVIELVLGHGTLYLMNEKNFVGGSLFVDNVYAGQITQGMAVNIREGKYEISFSKGDLNGKEEITMNRYGTVVINLEPYEQASTDYGYVDFRIKPEGASLFIDDFYYDTNEPVKLSYGIHKAEVTKQGYVTWSGTITVGTESMKIPIELVEQFAPTPTPTDAPVPTDDPYETQAPTPTPTQIPFPTDPPSPTPFPEGDVEVTIAWFPSATILVDGETAGVTDNDGNLKIKVKYGDHVIGLVRTTQTGQTTPKNYTVTIYPDAPTVLSFPTQN